MNDFPLEKDEYELLQAIGKGGTSVVYEAKCKKNGKRLAIKIIDLEVCPIEIDVLRQEVSFWSTCSHPNILSYYGSFMAGHFLYILTEYMAGGSISEIMRFSSPSGFKNEAIIGGILRELLKGLAYFHENHQIHRDVKSGNILMDEEGHIKIGDFGVSANLLQEGQRMRARFTVIGTPCYMAPEVLREDGGYSESADIWSLGITAIELACGLPPYSNLYPLEVIMKILESPPPTLPAGKNYSSALRDFISCCLNTHPEKRKTAEQLLQHKFIKKGASLAELKLNLFSNLPSLASRFSQLNPNFSENIQNESDKPIVLDLPWDFSIISQAQEKAQERAKETSPQNNIHNDVQNNIQNNIQNHIQNNIQNNVENNVQNNLQNNIQDKINEKEKITQNQTKQQIEQENQNQEKKIEKSEKPPKIFKIKRVESAKTDLGIYQNNNNNNDQDSNTVDEKITYLESEIANLKAKTNELKDEHKKMEIQINELMTAIKSIMNH